MADLQQLETALRNAHNAGDIGAATKLAGAIKSMQVEDVSTLSAVPEDIDYTKVFAPPVEVGLSPELNQLTPEAFKSQMGVLSTGDPKELQKILKTQLGDQISFEEDEHVGTVAVLPSGRYALNSKNLTMQDALRFAGDVAAYLPANKAKSVIGAIVGNALTETAIQSGEKAFGGDDVSAIDVAVAGGVGGVGKQIENLIGTGYRATKGKIDDSAEALLQAGRNTDTPVLTTDAIKPDSFVGRSMQQLGEKIPVIGTGGVREVQQAARNRVAVETAEKYGEYSYPKIVESLKGKASKVKQAAGRVLESVGNKMDDLGEIDISETRKLIDDVQTELTKPNVIKDSTALNHVQEVTEALKQPQTFTSLKENRTVLREIIESVDAKGRSQMPTRSKGLLSKLKQSMTDSMKGFAKRNLTDAEYVKWERANSVWASEAKALTKTKLKNVLDKGDITPEAVETMLFSQKPSEVRQLYAALGDSGRKNARSAIISKAVTNASKTVNGFSPNAFATQLRKIAPQVGVFFRGKEKAQVEGLRKLLEHTARAQDAAVVTPTGQSVTLLVGLLGGATVPLEAGIGAATIGTAARIYESAPVRNALLKLASVPKSSTAFEQAISAVEGALVSQIQALRSNPEALPQQEQ